MASGTIVVIEDERNIRDLIRVALEADGYRVLSAVDGVEGLTIIQQRLPDLVVLDLMLPKVDGWEVARSLRKSFDVPIIIVSARRDEIDRVAGLELGADAYVVKPFSPRELVARVGAVLRRSRSTQRVRTLEVGAVRVDLDRRRVTINDIVVEMRPREFELLVIFLAHPEIVLSREQILREIWGTDGSESTRTVDVHASQLRTRLEGSGLVIESLRGVGYRLTQVP